MEPSGVPPMIIGVLTIALHRPRARHVASANRSDRLRPYVETNTTSRGSSGNWVAGSSASAELASSRQTLGRCICRGGCSVRGLAGPGERLGFPEWSSSDIDPQFGTPIRWMSCPPFGWTSQLLRRQASLHATHCCHDVGRRPGRCGSRPASRSTRFNPHLCEMGVSDGRRGCVLSARDGARRSGSGAGRGKDRRGLVCACVRAWSSGRMRAWLEAVRARRGGSERSAPGENDGGPCLRAGRSICLRAAQDPRAQGCR